MAFALDGVKIVEMGPFAPANMAGQNLGDLGADVIVVEPPSNRALGPEWDKSDRFRPETNRNKRMIGLDLKQEEARAILHKLVKNADVLIEANRPGIAKRLGFDYETLSAINPRLIVASLTGYGQKGPMSHMPGHGLAWEGTGGWLMTQGQGIGNIGGDYAGEPWINYFNLADIKGAANFTIAILAALYVQKSTGIGQYLDMALFDGVIAVRKPGVPPRGNGAYNSTRPQLNAYQCKDGKYIAIQVSEALQWSNMCEGLGVPELAKERGATGQRAQEIIKVFQGIFKTRTRDEWFNHLSQWDTEVAKANTLDEARDDPQVKLREMHVEVVGKDGYREIQYGTPYKLSKTPARKVHTRAPKLGEDTPKILAELGFKQADITRLKKAGTVI
ncbi:MAG: CaiB/BaiF CoA-transferase family protein [Dehalococcoidia bacterium]|nr:CaiB/BaiF CoA-transferase family protein [Dehalococcoidia bacterium]